MVFARHPLARGSVNTAQAPNHDVGYIRDGRIRGEKNKTRHGDSGTWGEMCITSWDSKCNVRTRNAIIMRTRPRSRRDAWRAYRERRRKTKRHGHVHEPLPGVTHPESASATVLLRGDKFSTGRSLVLHSRNVATQSVEPRIKLAVSLLTEKSGKI